MEPGAIVGAAEELESFLEAQGVLCGAVRCLDAADKGGHLPLGLAGGRGQEGLVALVQGARPHRLGHRQHRDLRGRDSVGSPALQGSSTHTQSTGRGQLRASPAFKTASVEAEIRQVSKG